ATYIFDSDRWGSRFVAALARARARGVEVRVLVDAVGARYSFPSIIGALHHRKLRAARFNRTLLPWRWTYANLRNHRKLLICDGRVGFTGGLNIRAGHVLADAPDHPVLDLHFRVAGPVVAQMTIAFAEDWSFATGERLAGPAWFPRPAAQGEVFARAIIDGPDADLHKLRWTVIAAIISARRRVRIVTPYFLPENDLVAAMKMASLRGVEVQLVLPANNNQILVKWACDSLLHQVLECGVSVYKTEGPFDHAKVMVVDDSWTLFGSANLDPRSLRLNFELDIEAYDEALAARVHTLIDARLTCATRITREALLGRGLARRLRDGVARLFIPYL
ncbi:MAG: cardiolipin synthase, partial [Proteobacteria bacterium]